MRVFFGGRGTAGGKKGIAGSQFKQKLSGKGPKVQMTNEEKYRAVIESKMNDMMMELANGKRKSFQLPGTKQDAPKEMSRSFKATMEQLAMKKVQKAAEKQKKKERDQERQRHWEKKAKEKAEQFELQKKQALLKQEADKAAGQSTYFFGYTEEKKDGWW